MTAAASEAERERMVDEFVRLCEIESPSFAERPMADALTRTLRDLGLDVFEDQAGAAVGSDAGNLIARLPGPQDAPTVMLCAHMDTVPLAAPVEVERENGVLRNANAGILGADNKAAVATILAATRYFLERGGSPVGLELVFTIAEEPALRGSPEIAPGTLRADFGFVFDHATPIGELIVAAPTAYRLLARFTGLAAHAGMNPERGHNAIVAAARAVARMPNGRIDEQTTANAGVVHGGSAINVVAERCEAELEARSLDDDEASRVVSEMVDHCSDAAGETECDVDCNVERSYRAYRLTRSSPPVRVATGVLEARGIEPVLRTTGGGSDANVFNNTGLPVLNVANGTERPHQTDESVTVAALEQMLDITIDLVEASARA